MITTVDIAVTVKVSYEAFQVPENAIQKTATAQLAASRPVPIRDLAQQAVDALAEDWLNRLYDKAGKPCPFKKSAFRGE